jgi:hypothetical protein
MTTSSALDGLIQLVTILIVLSVSSERLVEIVKSRITALRTADADPAEEAKRCGYLHMLAVVAGCFTAYLALPWIKSLLSLSAGYQLPDSQLVLGLGLLASGGSSLWNTVLSYLVGIKQAQKNDLQQMKNTWHGGGVALEDFPTAQSRTGVTAIKN